MGQFYWTYVDHGGRVQDGAVTVLSGYLSLHEVIENHL